MSGKSTAIHLVLDYSWFDMIERGEKTEEYRRDIPYYWRRLEGKTEVVFHKGYTKKTMTFKIASWRRRLASDGSDIVISLGERLS